MVFQMRGVVFECRRCGHKDERSRAIWHVFLRHIDIEKCPFRCIMCDKKFQSEGDVRTHTSGVSHNEKVLLSGYTIDSARHFTLPPGRPTMLSMGTDRSEEKDLYIWSSAESKEHWSQKGGQKLASFVNYANTVPSGTPNRASENVATVYTSAVPSVAPNCAPEVATGPCWNIIESNPVTCDEVTDRAPEVATGPCWNIIESNPFTCDEVTDCAPEVATGPCWNIIESNPVTCDEVTDHDAAVLTTSSTSLMDTLSFAMPDSATVQGDILSMFTILGQSSSFTQALEVDNFLGPIMYSAQSNTSTDMNTPTLEAPSATPMMYVAENSMPADLNTPTVMKILPVTPTTAETTPDKSARVMENPPPMDTSAKEISPALEVRSPEELHPVITTCRVKPTGTEDKEVFVPDYDEVELEVIEEVGEELTAEVNAPEVVDVAVNTVAPYPDEDKLKAFMAKSLRWQEKNNDNVKQLIKIIKNMANTQEVMHNELVKLNAQTTLGHQTVASTSKDLKEALQRAYPARFTIPKMPGTTPALANQENRNVDRRRPSPVRIRSTVRVPESRPSIPSQRRDSPRREYKLKRTLSPPVLVPHQASPPARRSKFGHF